MTIVMGVGPSGPRSHAFPAKVFVQVLVVEIADLETTVAAA